MAVDNLSRRKIYNDNFKRLQRMSFHLPKILYTEQKQLPPPLKDYVTLNVTQDEIGKSLLIINSLKTLKI